MEMLVFLLIIATAALVLFQGVTVTVNTSLVGEIDGGSSRSVTYETLVKATPDILPAQAGTLTVRGGNTSGTLTMDSASHGITTGQKVDLYWDGGKAYRATVGTVSGTSVPIASVTAGNNLPVADTVINVGIPVTAAFEFDGDDAQVLVLHTQITGYILLVSISGTAAPTIHLPVYVEAGNDYVWDSGSTLTNPIATDDITHAIFSQSGTTETATQTTARAGING